MIVTMEDDSAEKESVIDDWHIAYKRGNDFDLWGQPVEAIDSYTRLAANMMYEVHPDGLLFTDEEKKVLKKLATCLELRSKTLHTPGKLESISQTDMKKVENSIKNITTLSAKDFPVDIGRRGPSVKSQPSVTSDVTSEGTSYVGSSNLRSDNPLAEEEECVDKRLVGSILPLPDISPEQTIVTVRIEKIGLKDAAQFLDSFITISLKDPSGLDLTPVQDSPVVHTKDDNHIYFGVDVYLQKPLEHLSDDVAVFFEFKHYKPKKKLISTKCWAFMEREEIKEGPVVLELYKKPANFKRKKMHLMTSKPLYLHLKIIFNG